MTIMNRALVRGLLLAAFGLTLAGCGGGDNGKFVGLSSCDKYGVVVWYLYPNAQGVYDTASVSPENCKR